jgi:hypothetical protein
MQLADVPGTLHMYHLDVLPFTDLRFPRSILWNTMNIRNPVRSFNTDRPSILVSLSACI